MEYINWEGSTIPFTSVDVDTDGVAFGASLQGIVDLLKSKNDTRATRYNIDGGVSLLIVSVIENDKPVITVFEIGDNSINVDAPGQVMTSILHAKDGALFYYLSERPKVNEIIDAFKNTPRLF